MDMERALEDAKATVMPFESWTRLAGETVMAYAAFCAYWDLRSARTYPGGRGGFGEDKGQWDRWYKVWRNWCGTYKWRERTTEYDRYTDTLKQVEMRKTIEAQGELHRDTTRKMMAMVGKKLDMMDPENCHRGP